jgi:hypothetical protein
MSEDPVAIDWHYQGEPEPLWGTGATRAEKALVWIAALLTLAWIGYFYPADFAGWWRWTWGGGGPQFRGVINVRE